MASFSQNKYCYNCKKNITTTKQDPTHCPACKSAIALKDWTVRFRVIENGHRKNKRLSGFATKKEAQQGLAQYLINYDAKTKSKQQNLIFKNIFSTYIRYQKGSITPATYYDKIKNFEKYILPYFADKDISLITKQDLVSWCDNLWIKTDKKGNLLSAKYKERIKGYFSSFMSYCEERYNIINYFKQIKLPKQSKRHKEMQIINTLEFQKFLNEIEKLDALNSFEKEMYKTIFMCLFFIGARINEVLALKIADIDLENDTISINKSVTRKFVREDYKNKYYLIKETKNCKTRKNLIPENLKLQLINYLKLKNHDDTFLFGNKEPIHDKKVTRIKNKCLNNAKLPYMRLHDFRHSHVSFLIHLGVSFPVIAQRIGDTLSVVVETYSHIWKNDEIIAIQNINNFYKKSNCT